MPKTIDLLFSEINRDMTLSHSVICDYFGYDNMDGENYDILYGIYQGLIKYGRVNKLLLENCFITNRLDELIHAKHTFSRTVYYQKFCKNNISIGKTYNILRDDDNVDDEDDEDDDIITILTDDYCPSCNAIGYYTKSNNDVHPFYNYAQCYKCDQAICKLCANSDKKGNYICYTCDNSNIKIAIDNKIRLYKIKDKENFGISGNITTRDVMDLLNKQKFRCYVCDDIVLTFGYKPRCLYQFSVDRIDNSQPHNRDNVLISCYYCNCIDYFTNVLSCDDNTKYKICSNMCHSEKRAIENKRETTSIEKINLLRLQ